MSLTFTFVPRNGKGQRKWGSVGGTRGVTVCTGCEEPAGAVMGREGGRPLGCVSACEPVCGRDASPDTRPPMTSSGASQSRAKNQHRPAVVLHPDVHCAHFPSRIKGRQASSGPLPPFLPHYRSFAFTTTRAGASPGVSAGSS